MSNDCLAVLDFGSQYAHLIAKRLRRQGFYTEIHTPASPASKLAHARGLILSGGPASVYEEQTPDFNSKLLELELPILGLCYGHQLTALHFGGSIENTGSGEFGKAHLQQTLPSALWKGIDFPTQVWMSHQDSVTELPQGFQVIGETISGSLVALQHQERPLFSLQFHPEVSDTLVGTQILSNFVELCKAHPSWSMERFIEQTKDELQQQVGEHNVLMFLSGGVDSSVAFALLNEALGKERVLGLFIDNGFLRLNEAEQILQRYEQLGYDNVVGRDYSEAFLEAIAGEVDPQRKRHQVGNTFLTVREKLLEESKLNPGEWLLGQGTLYPDIIESGGTEHAKVIKSHHNRVDAIQDLIAKGQVVEPLKELYKDEVRRVGELLGLPNEIVWRHPFPGPGLSINVLCSNEDTVLQPEHKNTLELLHQHLLPTQASLLPVRSVGVQGDQRTYTEPAVLLGPKDWEWLENTSIQLTNQVRAINRVVAYLPPQPTDQLPNWQVHRAFCDKPRLDLLRAAEACVSQTFANHDWLERIFQLLVILLPLSQTGSHDSIVLRPVISEDVMTARFAPVDWQVLHELLPQLYALDGIDSVFFDITHKPPATFGWE